MDYIKTGGGKQHFKLFPVMRVSHSFKRYTSFFISNLTARNSDHVFLIKDVGKFLERLKIEKYTVYLLNYREILTMP